MKPATRIGAASGIVATLAALVLMHVHDVASRSASSGTTTQDATASSEPKPPPDLKTASGSFQSSATSADEVLRARWTTKFRSTDDYLKFIFEALPAAQKGDGRAAWYIGESLKSCALVMKTYADSADSGAQLNQELASMPRAAQWARDLVEQRTQHCLGLAQQDPFEGLPPRAGGYVASYWREQALKNGDPLAREDAAARALTSMSVGGDMPDSDKKKILASVQTDLRTVITSGDPDALFNAGLLLADSRYSDNPLDGIAIALAACDLGRDCSAGNPENAFSQCKLTGACPPDADYAYFLQQSLRPQDYVQVYAHAQEVKRLIEAGDAGSVLASFKFDHGL